ncbi:MAG: hypothetical protein AAF623_19190 [Planctomycetota bacterium]
MANEAYNQTQPSTQRQPKMKKSSKINRKSNRGGRRNSNSTRYQSLEDRRLRAGMYLDQAQADLFVWGGAGDDIAIVETIGSQIRVKIDNVDQQTFDSAAIDEIFFIGLEGDDTFVNGTSIKSSAWGNEGNDTFLGGSNDDLLVGGAGDDNLFGDGGDDIIIGLGGNDGILGGDGDDQLFGSEGENTIFGEAGDDWVYGGEGNDILGGNEGADWIIGLGGDDRIETGSGGVAGSIDPLQMDLVFAGEGNDTVYGGLGLNVIFGQEGNDEIYGGDGENRISGNSGDDTIHGGAIADILAGDAGDDTIVGKGGNDWIFPAAGNDVVDGGTGEDIVKYQGVNARYSMDESGHFIVHDNGNVDGTDLINDIEYLQHADGWFVPRDNTSGGGNNGGGNGGGGQSEDREKLYFVFNQAGDSDRTTNSRKLYSMVIPETGKYRLLMSRGPGLTNPVVEIRDTNQTLLYRGSATDSLGRINFTFDATGGTTYYLNVISAPNTDGSFVLDIKRSFI